MSTLIEMSVSQDGTVVFQSMKGDARGYIDIKGPGFSRSYEYTPSVGWSGQSTPNEISVGGTSLRFETSPDGAGGTNVHFTGERSHDIAPGPVDFVLEYDAEGNATGLKVGTTIGIDGVASISLGGYTNSDRHTNLPQEHLTISPDGTVYRTTFLASHPSMPGAGAVALVSIFGPTGMQLGETTVHDVDEEIGASIASDVDRCFKSNTPIQMWPLDPSIKPRADGTYDEELVLSHTWKKQIDQVAVGDIVVSYDAKGNLTPNPVVRTFQNDADLVLDFFGTGVTPGHVTFCGEGGFAGQHIPIIDILRSDGAIARSDGTLVRAATGCEVGSEGDRFVVTIIGEAMSGGKFQVKESGQIRLGTRVRTNTGLDISVLELIQENGGQVTEDGMIIRKGSSTLLPFVWAFGPELPRPEDYVLARSGFDLAKIYEIGEWEGCGTQLPHPEIGSEQFQH